VGLRSPENMKRRLKNLDVRAVRGPATREFLIREYGIHVPETFGDPAMLLPVLFPELQRNTIPGRIGIIPHFRNRGQFPDSSETVRVILPNQDPAKVVAEILRCEFVIAGSLHGIIVAEAFGIPARWLNNCADEPDLKYFDYYASTQRHPRFATTLKEAELLGGEAGIGGRFNSQKLLNSFPSEIDFALLKK
jgi:pyruvyltransferase